ncbi:MAG: SH3 domain-containing protein [Peptococcaceae bacterium]|jgi:hypothetical protein|nr:SH3 domain-containing protein [Peptococcaceae bacterium]
MRKKAFALTALTVLAALLFLGWPPRAALAQTAGNTSITNLEVRPDNNAVSENSRYQITFNSNQILNGGLDTIHIVFPSEFKFPSGWQAGYIDVNGQICGGVDYSKGTLTILLAKNTTIYGGQQVIVNLAAGIMKNPEEKGEYSLTVYTSRETLPIQSPRFTISEFISNDGVSMPRVTLGRVKGYEAEQITVSFMTNKGGQLIGGVDQILIDFPAGFRLPQTVSADKITVNQIKMHGLNPVIVGQKAILPLSSTMNFPDNYPVEVVFAPDSGITISRDNTNATLKVTTTKNTATVTSFPFDMSKTPDQIYMPVDDKNPTVKVTPNGAGALGQYTFTFERNSIELMEDTSVLGFTLTFPNGTVLPGAIAPQHITVNGQQSAGVLINPSRREVIFTLPVGAPISGEIQVVVAAAAGIQNPPPAIYIMGIAPLKGIRTMDTKSFEIKIVSDVEVTPVDTSPKVVSLTLNQLIAIKDGTAVILDVPPQLIDGFTMVPARFVMDALGIDVEYDNNQNTVTLRLGSREIVLWPGSTLAKIDNQVVTLAKAPVIKESRTLLPVRFVSECFGAKVEYVSATEPIVITLTADALLRMPTVAEIQAAQTGAAAATGGGAGTGSGTTTGGGTAGGTAGGTTTGGGTAGSAGTGTGGGTTTGGTTTGGGATGNVGRNITLKTGLNQANMRKGAGTNHEVVAILLPSETAKITEVSGDWYKVEFSYGLTAWIRNDMVDIT